MYDAESGCQGVLDGVESSHILSFAGCNAVCPCEGFAPNEGLNFENDPCVNLGRFNVDIVFACESTGSDL